MPGREHDLTVVGEVLGGGVSLGPSEIGQQPLKGLALRFNHLLSRHPAREGVALLDAGPRVNRRNVEPAVGEKPDQPRRLRRLGTLRQVDAS